MKVRISMKPNEFKSFIELVRTMFRLEVQFPKEQKVLSVLNQEALQNLSLKCLQKRLEPLKKKTIVTLNDAEIVAFVTADDNALSHSDYWVTYREIIAYIDQETNRLYLHNEMLRNEMSKIKG